ncbi:MAG: glycerophosphodiester phosphodiesterase [Spirochaeta sp.]|jgi:glycerophosphoryl diester phosphodiesterase|nr:glycerophosphodiester phosphodiesterase [Spirochaeta sp.]
MKHGKMIGKKRVWIPTVLAVILIALMVTAQPVPEHAFFRGLPDDRPLVIAHRGGAALMPENTLVSFANGYALGADILEMDVHATADGVPVVIHDATVDRTTDGSGAVDSFTVAELRRLDAAYRFSPADDPDTFPLRGAGIVVPTLREVFAAFPDAHMIVEIKERNTDLADEMISLVREFDRVEQTVLASFHHEMLTYFRTNEPNAPSHGSEKETIPFLISSWLFLAGVISPEYHALMLPPTQGPLPVITRRLLTAAARRNVRVYAWTINDPDDMQILIERGVDGLITDRPDLARETVP